MFTKQADLMATGTAPQELSILRETIYPECSDRSIALVASYCKAQGLDPLMKPWHITKRKSKDKNGSWVEKEVLMPGIDLYRIRAHRSGNYVGLSTAEFGPAITECLTFGTGQYAKTMDVTYPEWCKMTVYKVVQGQRAEFSAKKYWKESFQFNNKIWAEQPYAQLEKCTEMVLLKKAWGEIEMHTVSEFAPIADAKHEAWLENAENQPTPILNRLEATGSYTVPEEVPITKETLGLIRFFIVSYDIQKESTDKWLEKYKVNALEELNERQGKHIASGCEKKFGQPEGEVA